jgi:hypothetical protein
LFVFDGVDVSDVRRVEKLKAFAIDLADAELGSEAAEQHERCIVTRGELRSSHRLRASWTSVWLSCLNHFLQIQQITH